MPAADRRLTFTTGISHEADPAAAGRIVSQIVRTGLASDPADLACLFMSSHYAEHAETLVASVQSSVAPKVLVGCTGEGVIGEDQEFESDPAVVLWAACLPDVMLTPVRPTFVHEHGHGDVRSAISGWPTGLEDERHVPTFLLFGDPFSAPMDEVLTMLADRYPGAPAIGGLAGGGQDVGENRLILDGDVFEDGLVGVALSGPIRIRTVISQGCRPIGEPYVVTKAERNVIYELGGEPALQRLQAAFESLAPEDREIASRALHVGIVTDEQRAHFERGDFLVRNLIGADRGAGSLAIGDVVREGQTVQFHVRDARSASEDLNLLLARDRVVHPKPPLSALLFSCCGRGRGLFGRRDHDIEAVRERAGKIPVAGFFAQGEIGPVGNDNFLHGYTASVAMFCEPE